MCHLSDVDNLPKDTFDRLTIDEITPYLVPTYFYHCNFDAPWSCIKLVYEKYKVGNETKTRTKRYPMNGIAQRGFDYVLPSCKIEDIPTELYTFIKDERSNLAYYDLSDNYELDEKDKSILVESSDDDESMVGELIEDKSAVSPLKATMYSNLKEITNNLLSGLTSREERVLRMRFGIGMESDNTLEDVGKQFSVTRERIRQIEAKALRKLKHPKRAGKLKIFLEEN